MLITLSRRTAICQSVAEVYLTGMFPFGAVGYRLLCVIVEKTKVVEINIIHLLLTNNIGVKRIR